MGKRRFSRNARFSVGVGPGVEWQLLSVLNKPQQISAEKYKVYLHDSLHDFSFTTFQSFKHL